MPILQNLKERIVAATLNDKISGRHDDSANDNSANDKMAARFSHTDDSATFLF